MIAGSDCYPLIAAISELIKDDVRYKKDIINDNKIFEDTVDTPKQCIEKHKKQG